MDTTKTKILKNIASGHLIPCTYCHKVPELVKPFKACSNCKFVVYCSKECQRNDWSAHKLRCKMVDHHNGTPYEQPLAKMRDWQVRNMSGLGHLAKLLTTTANASTHLLMVQLSMNETEDESKVFKIESVSSMEID